MRILHCVANMAGGGAERQVGILARSQTESGDEVHVALVHGGPNLAILEESGARLHWITAGNYYDPRIVWHLRRTIRDVRPNVVQSWLLQMDVAAGIAALTSGTPWVLSERVSKEFYRGSAKGWLRRHLGRHAGAVVANSRAGAEYWDAAAGARLRAFVIPNAVPFERIAAAAGAPQSEMDSRPLILFAGRLVRQKNTLVMLEAIAEVLHRRFDARALICGEGPELVPLQRVIHDLGMADRIRMAGYRSDLWSVMKSASVFVSLSLFEGHPNAVLEAMACRCPLVVSDIPEHREFLDERSAWLPSPTNKSDMVRAIGEVLENPSAAARKADMAWDIVQRYTASNCAARYREVYEVVVGHPPAHR